MGLDLDLMQLVADNRPGWATATSWAMLRLGTHPGAVLVVLLLSGLVVVALRAWAAAAAILVAVGVSAVLAATLKLLIRRPRPPEEFALLPVNGFAFPSDTAAVTAAGAITLFLFVGWSARRHRAWVGVLLAAGLVLVAAAMVYLGAHWPTDVLAGWAIGAAVGGAVAVSMRRMQDLQSRSSSRTGLADAGTPSGPIAG